MKLRSSKLAGTVILCSIALSACAPIKKRFVTISPGNAQTSTVVKQEAFPQNQPRRVVRRAAPSVRSTAQPAPPTPVAVSAPSVRQPAAAATPVIPVAAEVKPAKKDCSVSGTPGCPAPRSFSEESGSDGGGGGGGWDG